MRYLLLGLAVIAACFVFSAPAWADEEGDNRGVTVETGTLRIGGTIKTGFNYESGGQGYDAAHNQAVDLPSDYQFVVTTAQLDFFGAIVEDHISYRTEIAYRQLSLGSHPEIAAIVLNELDLGFDYIPFCGIHFGLLKPNFSYFVNAPERDFILIDLPLMNQWIVNRDRQVGGDLRVNTPYLDVNLGLFNGRLYTPAGNPRGEFLPAGAANPVGNPGWSDQNNGKDIYVNLVGKPPVDGLRIRAGLWYGTPLDFFKVSGNRQTNEHDARVYIADAGVSFLSPFGLTIIGEYMQAFYVWDAKLPTGQPRGERYTERVESMSYYAMAGYNFDPIFNVPIELLARYDYYNPDEQATLPPALFTVLVAPRVSEAPEGSGRR